MSVTQTVKGRIRNKHQTEADWLKSVYVDGDRSKGFLANPFIPLDGELIIYDPDVAHPYKRLKFGDEKTNVDALPFAFYAKNEIDNFEFITFDEVPTADSTSLVTSASVYNALSAKQDILTFDNDPTEGSANPVTSSGLFSKFQAHQEQIDMNAMSATLAMPGSLKWDGVIGDREHIIVGSVDRFNMCFVHVSDEYPALLDPTAAFTVGVVEIGAPQMAYMAEVVIQDDGFIVGDSFVIVPQDNYEADGVVLPKKGVYFMSYHFAPIGYDISFVYCSALSIMGHSFADNSGSDASKYFEKKITTEMGSVGDTLTWDGDTTGRVIVDGGTLGTGILTYCKISESIPTVDAFANGYSNSIVENGVTTTKSYTAEDVKITARDDGYITSLYFMVIPTDNFIVSDSLTVSESGVYFVKAINSETGVVSYVSSLSIPGYDFIAENIITTEIIKTEHLPEALQFGEITTTTYGDTLTWDGNTDGLNGLEYDAEIIATYYKVSDVVPTLEQLKQGCASTRTKTDGTTSSLEFTIELLASLAMADDGSIFILDTLVLTRPITKTDSESGISTTYPAGVYFYTNTNGVYTSSFTINNYSGFVTTTTEFKTIDPKYLPEDIGGGSGGLPEVTTDDNSKTVKVVDGAWSVEKLSYNDLLDKPTLGTLASKNSLSASDVGLGNVENKSSATIRSEITKNNVTTALGYTLLLQVPNTFLINPVEHIIIN